MKSYPITTIVSNHRSKKESPMFAFMKKHAVAITITTAALLAAGLGFTWFRPGVVGGALKAIGASVSNFGTSVIGFFRRAPTPVDAAAAGMGTPSPAV